VVLPASARLNDPHYRATNVLIPGCGHLTICARRAFDPLAGQRTDPYRIGVRPFATCHVDARFRRGLTSDDQPELM